MLKTIVIGSLFMVASPAMAGPLDSALAGFIGSTPAWWIEGVAVVSALLSLVSALVKDTSLPPWLAQALAIASSNWGKAANDPERN